MPACQLYFVVGVTFFLLGLIGSLMGIGRRPAQAETKQRLSMLQWLFIVIMLAGAGIATNNLQGYVNCKARAGGCPASFPAGSTGYTCSNEYEQCAYAKNCITVKGKYFWESDCECKCVSTSD